MDKMKSNLNRNLIPILLVLGIIIVVNIISQNVFTRLDLTENKIYSLSQASKNLIGNLNDKVHIKAFFSKGLPGHLASNERMLKDLLEEYKNASHGMFDFEFYPNEDPSVLKSEATKYQIQPGKVQEIQEYEVNLREVVMGLAILYKDKSEVLPFIQDMNTIEYEIASRINKLQRDKAIKIGFLQGHGEYSASPMQSELQYITGELRKQFEVEPVTISNSYIEKDYDVIVIAGPTQMFSEWDLYAIDQYLMEGGRLIVMARNIEYNLNSQRSLFGQYIVFDQQTMANFNETNISKILKSYGATIQQNLVNDKSSMPKLMYTGGNSLAQQNYDFILDVKNMNKDLPVTKMITNIFMPFASTVDTSYLEGKDLTYTTLFTTSAQAGTQTGRLNIISGVPYGPQLTYDKQYLNLGGIIQGNFTSYYAGKDLPDTVITNIRKEKVESSPESRIAIIGNAEMISDQFISENRAINNLQFAVNLVDWFAQDDDLISIRTKEFTDRTLSEDITYKDKKFHTYFNILAPVVLLLLIGLYIRRRRIQKRKEYFYAR